MSAIQQAAGRFDAAAPDAGASPLLDALTAGRPGRLTHARTLPGREPAFTDWPVWASPDLVSAYQALGVERPWTHQVEAADLAWAGRHTVLATATGSGKSLAFWLPALSAIIGGGAEAPQPDADAASELGPPAPNPFAGLQISPASLYLSPTKALAADQLASLQRLLRALPDAQSGRVWATTCDGDTPTEQRKWIQQQANAVLTNPDFLHFSLLPGHRRWARLLRGLRFVIVDEAHTYRGVFGAHISLVLRRLARLVEHYGGGPLVFLLASATSATPARSGARLLGLAEEQVTAVTDDGSPAGRKTVALWQPPELGTGGSDEVSAAEGPTDAWDSADDSASAWGSFDEGGDFDAWAEVEAAPGSGRGSGKPVALGPGPRRSATSEAAELLAQLVEVQAQTLAFTRSRRGAESVAAAARRHLERWESPDAGKVAAYRGGYLPEERRELERALREGDLLGLATTNALELGVDISGLDAVLIAGWPGTNLSLWQQAGRAGRAGQDGTVVFVAREDPLDTFLVHHPEALFDAPLEATVFDAANRYVLAPQLCVAAQELPLRSDDLARFGNPAHVRNVLDELTEGGALRHRPSGWYWTHHQSAAALTDLRGSGGRPVSVIEAETGRLLGTVDAGSADGQVHTGAVYVHQGNQFVVAELDLEDKVAVVVRRDVDFGTWSRELTSVAIMPPEDDETSRRMQWGPVTWGLDEVEVTSQVVGYERRRIPDLQVLDSASLDLPERSLRTVAVWWSVPPAALLEVDLIGEVLPGALHAAEHAAIGLLPLFATCDRWDLGGLSTDMHVDTEAATVFVYDAYPGGAGFAERGFEMAADWLRATRTLIAECDCEAGCPACIQSPKCGTNNSPLNKQGAVRLLDLVLSHAPEAAA